MILHKKRKKLTWSNIKPHILKVWAVIGGISIILSILGYSVRDLFEKDWQGIAEEKNSEALELYNKGEFENSIKLYDYVIGLEKKNIRDLDVVYFNRGMAYYKISDYHHAIGDFTNAINIKPRSKYYLNRANAYEKNGDTDKALEDRLKSINE